MTTKHWLLTAALAACITQVQAQSTLNDMVVAATANVQASPPKITLNWASSSDAVQYAVFRKLGTESSFGSSIAVLNGNENTFTDNNVVAGVQYDYLIRKNTSSYFAYGDLSAGIALPIVQHRGAILLVIDSTLLTPLASELAQFKLDLIGDGWGVATQNVATNMSVPAVKAKISSWYNKDKNHNVAVLLIGHVPVPYSGLMQASGTDYPPDAHPDHGGAWPTDLYYAEMDGSWTDNGTMVPAGSNTRNQNNPGDGKFDQHDLPSDIDLQIGRIDMYDLPTFGKTEVALLKQYFKKDHQYRQRLITVPQRGLIGDNLGVFGGEAPGRCGLMNFVPLFSNTYAETVSPPAYFDSLLKKSYIFSLASSSAGYTSINNIGSVDRFKDSILSVFHMSFGSYHGDWDNTNNMLRGCLASKGLTLTNVWSGRPVWHFIDMGMGKNIGYSALVTQNNDDTYFPGFFPRRIHVNLLGDPTLRLHMITPVSNLTSSTINSNTQVKLNWTASPDNNIMGYHVFRATKQEGPYELITSSPVSGTTYTDTDPHPGKNAYMVRAVRLEQTPTGSYYNMSQGAFTEQASVSGTNNSIHDILESFDMVVYPNPASTGITALLPGSFSKVHINMCDISGKQVYVADNTDGNAVCNINTSAFERGIYILTIVADGKTANSKIVLQ